MPRRAGLALCLLVAGGAPGALAQGSAPLRGGMVEATGFYHQLTDDFGDWRGGRLRAVLPAGRRTVVYLEGVGQRAFGDDGAYGTAALQQALGDDWITFVSAGAGSGEFFFPELRLDAMLTRKLLASRRLLVSAGGTYVRSKDVYRDRTAVASLTGYLGPAAVLEVSGRFNWSTPGDVTSRRGAVALTLGRLGQRYVVLRGGAGTESYQLTGPGAVERSFTSTEASLTWREWLGRHAGFVLGGEWYDNPFYTRTGVQAGFFVGW